MPLTPAERCKRYRQNTRGKLWYATNREANRQRSNAWSEQHRQLTRQRATEWYRANKQRAKERYQQKVIPNREVYLSARRERYLKNREKICEQNRSLSKDHPLREKARARSKQWKKDNPERARAADQLNYAMNGEKIRRMVIEYQKTHRTSVRAWATAGRIRRLYRVPAWLTANDRKKIRAFYDLAAQLTRETGIPWQVDHIIPLRGRTVSGFHVPSNLQVIPGVENKSKGNRYDGELTHA